MISPEALRRYIYFTTVSEPSLRQVAAISEEKTARKGDVLFREGEEATHLHILIEGEVDVQYELGDGSHQTVDTLVAGDLMVWSSVLEPHTTHSMGVARTNVRLVAIDAPRLRALMESDPVLGYRLMSGVAREVSHRLEGARVRLAAM
ncbi:MAG: cyclic nucleotide-binding domain-containing protein [Planctomycetes bacterium]|nr:cyclic nucleotide-binding domain-containing protein [Planctomycetota bacterium]